MLHRTEMGRSRLREEQLLTRALPLMSRKPKQLTGVHSSAPEGEGAIMPATWGRAGIRSWKRKAGVFWKQQGGEEKSSFTGTWVRGVTEKGIVSPQDEAMKSSMTLLRADSIE